MAEIISSIVAKVSEHLVDLMIRQGQYLFRVNKIMKNLESEKKALALTHDDMQKRVEEAGHKAERVNSAVSRWLNEAMELMEEVEQLEQEIQAHRSGCFQGQYPTRKRYSLCKQMEKKAEAMIQLSKNCHFEPFSQPAPIPDIEHFSSGNFVYFKSTRLAADQLLEALKDDSSYIIGLYGMGGSGKTTLIKEVGKKAKELKHFDHVVFATVSQSPNVMKIQDEIADLLGLKLDEKSEAGRARRISVRLQSGERILIILDDVWAKLNLEYIGIPADGKHKGCKVLLTTRRQEVCNLMDCPRRIPLDLLSEEEAWSLFQKHAGINDVSSSNSLNHVQRKVCKECKGLPIAIVAVGSSLKGKSSAVDEWKVALKSLRDSKPVDVDEGVGDAFNCLKLSYDYLKSEDAKLLFLMCSMFPEDHEIHIDDLFKYGVGLGICGESFDLARNQLRVCINILVNSCLLMCCETSKVDQVFRHKNDYVKMHDMVRDVALWIASKYHTAIVNLGKDLNRSIDNGVIKDCFALSSWYNKGIGNFLHRLDAPNLQILLLNLFAHTIPLGLAESLELSDELFQGLKELKVLALINKNYWQKVNISLPQSLQLSTNLRTLRLVGWDLGDISFVVSLKGLEILDLQDSKFKRLPNGIALLDKLKLLDLSQCQIEESCFKVIRRCLHLEELYVFNYGDFSSPRMMDPYQCFEDKHDINFPNLQRYKLYIGPLMSRPSELHSSSTRLLYVNGFNPYASDDFVKYLLQRTCDVRLHGLHGGCTNIFPDTFLAVGSMNEVTNLQLNFCSDMECLINTTCNSAGKCPLDTMLPRLEELRLEHMDNLKELWRGPLLHCFFDKLQVLRVHWCNQLHKIFPRQSNMQNLKKLSLFKCQTLTSIFLVSVAKTLVKLEYLFISECSELRYIINNEQEDGTDTGEVTVHVPSDSREILPELKELIINSCGKLEYILPNSCVEGLLLLRKIQISLVPKLKYIFDQCHTEDQLSYLNSAKMALPHLEEVELESLPNLLGIFSENYHLSWECLKKLVWRNCPKLNTNPSHNMNFALEHQQLPPNTETRLCKESLTSKLEKLSLLNVHDLRFIWTASTLTQTLRLQHLQYLSVTRCRKLKSIFPSVIQRCLPELLELYIGNCEELEEIVAENEKYDNVPIAEVCFPKLTRIEVRRCSKLASLFSTAIARMLPQLSILIIVDAPQLKEIFRYGDEEGTGDGELLIFQNLKEVRLEELKSLVDVGIMLNTPELCNNVRIHECPNVRSSIIDSASSGNRGTTDESNR